MLAFLCVNHIPGDLAFQGGRIGVKGIYSLGPRLLWFLFSTDNPKDMADFLSSSSRYGGS